MSSLEETEIADRNPGMDPLKRLVAVLPLALFVVACAGGASGGGAPEPPPPPEFDPAGVYDCLLYIEGMEMGATLTIEGDAGAYTGTVDTEMGLESISDISVDGQEMTFVVDTPEMVVFFALVFDGDSVSGDFDAGGMGGSLSGTKR